MSKLRLGHKIAIGAGLCVALLLFFLSSIVKSKLEKKGPELLGRQITLDELHFNYFRGSVRAKGFILYEEDSTGHFVAFKELYANANVIKIITGNYEMEEFFIDSLNVRVEQNKKWFNFSDIIEHVAQLPKQEKKEKKKDKPLKYILKDVSIKDSYIHYTDQHLSHNIDLNSINLNIPTVVWDEEHFDTKFGFDFNRGGKLTSHIDLNKEKNYFTLDLGLDKFSLKIIEPYLRESLNFGTVDGRISQKLKITGNLDHISHLLVQGNINLNDFAVTDTEKQHLAKIKSMQIGLDSLDLKEMRLAVSEVKITQPDLAFELYKDGNTVDKLLAANKKEETAPSTKDTSSAQGKKQSPFQYSIKKVTIDNGSIAFHDQSLEPNVQDKITDLNITAGPIRSDDPKLHSETDFALESGGSLSTIFDLNQETFDYTLHLAMKDLEIEPFYPYAAKGLNIGSLKGKLTNEFDVEGNLKQAAQPQFKGTNSLKNFAVTDEKKQKVVAFDELFLNIQSANLEQNNFVLEEIRLDKPEVAMTLYKNGNSFERLIKEQPKNDKKEGEGKATSSSKKEQKQPTYTIGKLAVNNGNIEFEDQSLRENFKAEVQNFNLLTKKITEKLDLDAHTDFSLASGGFIDTDVKFSVQKKDIDLKLKTKDLVLKEFEPYIKEAMRVNDFEGTLSNDIAVQGNLEKADQLKVQGLVTLTAFNMTDTTASPVVAVDEFVMDMKNVDLGEQHFELKTYRMVAPYLRMEIYKEGNNLSSLSRSEKPKEDEKTKTNKAKKQGEEKPMFLAFDTLNISKGAVDFMDHTMADEFKYRIDSLNIQLKDYSEGSAKRNIIMAALLNKTGNFKANLDYDKDDMREMDFTASIDHMDMRPANPYAVQYTKYPIENGILEFKEELSIHDLKLKSKNEIIMHKIYVGDKITRETDQNDLPIKLALAVLRDPKGDVKLDVPISGDLNDPNFHLGKVIINSLKNITIKAATSPYNIVAGAVNGDPRDLQAIDFNYLQHSLNSPEQIKQLKLISKVFQKKKGLNIIFKQYTNYEEELGKAALLVMAEQDSKRELKDKEIDHLGTKEKVPGDVKDYVDKAFKKNFKHDDNFKERDKNLTTEEKALAIVGKARANEKLMEVMNERNHFLANYFTKEHNIPADRFKVVTENLKTTVAQDKKPHYRISFY